MVSQPTTKRTQNHVYFFGILLIFEPVEPVAAAIQIQGILVARNEVLENFARKFITLQSATHVTHAVKSDSFEETTQQVGTNHTCAGSLMHANNDERAVGARYSSRSSEFIFSAQIYHSVVPGARDLFIAS